MKKVYFFVLMLFFITAQAQITPDANNILYVDKNVSGGNGSGNSWTNAIHELADALKWANDNKSTWGATSDSLRIYVAKGTYLPKYSPEDGVNYGTDQGRDNTFLMVKDVQVFGGFPTGGSTLANRNWVANPTVLSGDFNNDDVVNGSGATLSITGNSENAYHVVVAAGAVGKVLLDGFTIRDGNSNGNGVIAVNGSYIFQDSGGGMYNLHSSPALSHGTISGNSASGPGGGMFNGVSSPILSDVTISGNAADEGGGMGNGGSSPILTNVTISGNAAGYGGGMQNVANSSPILTNVTISGNSAVGSGGGIINLNNNNGFSSPNIYNSIIWGNTASGGNNNIYNLNISPFSPFPTPKFYNSLIEGSGGSASWVSSFGIDSGNNIDINPQFVNPSNGNYSLQAASPAINAGSNTYYTNNGGDLQNDKDLAGHTRLIGANVDLGAYEYSSIYPTSENIVFVDSSVSVSGDGSSWANAVKELADALLWAKQSPSAIGDSLRIFVAKGTYLPKYSPEDGANFGTNQGRDNTFLMVKDVQVLGGFPTGGSTLANRNWVANPTVLSGDIGTPNDSTDNAYHVVVAADSVGNALIDGFTIRDGNADEVDFITVNGKNYIPILWRRNV